MAQKGSDRVKSGQKRFKSHLDLYGIQRPHCPTTLHFCSPNQSSKRETPLYIFLATRKEKKPIDVLGAEGGGIRRNRPTAPASLLACSAHGRLPQTIYGPPPDTTRSTRARRLQGVGIWMRSWQPLFRMRHPQLNDHGTVRCWRHLSAVKTFLPGGNRKGGQQNCVIGGI